MTTKKKKHAPAPAKPAAPVKSAEALAKVQAEMAALSPDDFVTINLDIPQAVSVVLGVVPHLAEMRDAIVKALPEHPIRTLDELETYALAAYHAHVLSIPPEIDENRVAALLEEATPLREDLLGDAEALARRRLLDAEAVAAIRAGVGNIDKANDLVALSALFTTEWETIQHKTAASLAEVRRAGELGPLLLAALGAREYRLSPEPVAAADRRKRAYTLFFRAYDETRRAIAYLRWHEGDAELFTPSLYKGRATHPSSHKDEAQGAAAGDAKPAADEPRSPG